MACGIGKTLQVHGASTPVVGAGWEPIQWQKDLRRRGPESLHQSQPDVRHTEALVLSTVS